MPWASRGPHGSGGHVAGLRKAVTALTQDLGNTIDVQRLRDDVVRLADDVDLVARVAGIGTHDRVGGPGEIVFIPDEDYDPSMWADADDELGPHGDPEPWLTPTSAGGPSPGRARISARTLREDRWWLPPFVTFVCFSAWLLYGAGPHRHAEELLVADYGYLTPFASPCVCHRLRPVVPLRRPLPMAGSSRLPAIDPAVPAAVPADLLLLPQGLLPGVLAVAAGLRGRRAAQELLGRDQVPADRPEPAPVLLLRRRDHLADQHLGRAARLPRQGRRFGLGLGTLILLANVVLLWCYTRLPLLPQHHRRPAQPLQPAPGRATGPGAGSPSSTPGTCSSPGSRSAPSWSPTPTSRLVASGAISDLRLIN